MCESPTSGDIQNKPLTNLYLLFFLLTLYSFCKIIFLSLNKPRFRTYNASKDVIGAFHNVLLMKTPVSLSNALLSKATRWQKLHSYWLAKATRCFLKQRVVATRNDPFGLPYSSIFKNVSHQMSKWCHSIAITIFIIYIKEENDIPNIHSKLPKMVILDSSFNLQAFSMSSDFDGLPYPRVSWYPQLFSSRWPRRM